MTRPARSLRPAVALRDPRGRALCRPPRDGHLVHLGGAVIDAKRADVAVDPAEHELLRGTHSARKLDRAVDHAAYRLAGEHLGARGLLAAAAALRDGPRRMPDHRAGRIEVDLVLGDERLCHA